jgi:transcriptional regulator with XRE-family HTH domain
MSSSSKSNSEGSVSTPGGARLRALREQAGRTQLWVELEAELGTGYLQRVESGRVAQPSRATLERILNALDARYSERRDVMEIFGYTVAATPPDAADAVWAREVSWRELHEVAFPAFVLDCTHRLIAWNAVLLQLVGIDADDPWLRRMQDESLLARWFEPESPFGRMVAEPDVLLPAIIRALRYEMQQFHTEPWYATVLDELQRNLPLFRHYWAVVEDETPPASAARAVVPLRLAVPGVGQLEFRLSSEHFTRDARFRIVYYFPADPITMRQCAEWATGDNGTLPATSMKPS